MIPTNNTIPYTARPWATLSIVGLCVAAFLYQMSLSQQAAETFLTHYALVPARYTGSAWAETHGVARFDLTPVITSMFLHGGILHIASNLWTLWVFGPALEDRLGSGRFVLLYLLSGIAAAVVHVIFNFSSAVPTLGASGAIAGVIAAYARRFPYAWVNILQPIAFIPIFFMMPALAFAVSGSSPRSCRRRARSRCRRARAASPGGRTSAASLPDGFFCAGQPRLRIRWKKPTLRPAR